MRFHEHLRLGKVRWVTADALLSQGLIRSAEEDFRIIANTEITDENASFFFKNSYDCLRAALQSFLALDGLKSYSHEAIIQYAAEKGVIDRRSAQRADRYRLLRHDIEYRAKKATRTETEEIIKLTGHLLPMMRSRLRREIERRGGRPQS